MNKNNFIIEMLRSPCNTCAMGPQLRDAALSDKEVYLYSCSAVGPYNGRCSDWVQGTVLIAYNEEPL